MEERRREGRPAKEERKKRWRTHRAREKRNKEERRQDGRQEKEERDKGRGS